MDGATMHGQNGFVPWALIPRLRKNKRIEKAWGRHYYAALKHAIFMVQHVPYVPAEPPQSLSEDVSESEPLYVCKYCRDCFRFSTSFEDHNGRHSWILGFWCHYCFLTLCSHVPQGANPCSQCAQIDKDKRSYLQSKCFIKKNRKLGATRVFYNQCQLFAHLKMHDLHIIDICDIMLMPMPDMDCKWTPALDRACVALMENAFLLQVHIMDWLKVNKVENNWWKLALAGGKNPVSDIMNMYQGDYIFKSGFENKKEDVVRSLKLSSSISDKSPDIKIISQRSKSSSKNSGYSSGDCDSSSDQNVSENEDNPCTPADIAFVDCGPTAKFYATEPLNVSSSKVSVKRIDRRYNTCLVKSDEEIMEKWQSAQISSENKKRKESASSKSEGSSTILKSQVSHQTPIMQKLSMSGSGKDSSSATVWRNNNDNQRNNTKKLRMDTESETSDATLKSTLSESSDTAKASQKGKSRLKIDNNVKQAQMSPNKKVLTFQRAKDVDLTSIMKQLPPHLLNSRKIVFIGQDNDGVTIQAKPKESLPTPKLQIMPDSTKRKVVKTVPQIVNISKDINKDDNRASKKADTNVKSGSDKAPSNSKIVYQNGRKYIIKESSVTNTAKNIVSTTSKTSESNCNPSSANPVNGDALEITLTQQSSLSQNDTSPLTPSPSPSELSTSSCETYGKQLSLVSEASKIQTINEYKETKTKLFTKTPNEYLSFRKGKNGAWYLNIKLSYTDATSACPLSDMAMMAKYKREMIQEFHNLSYKGLKERADHLEEVRQELSRFKGILENKVMIQTMVMIDNIEMELEEQMEKCAKNTDKEDSPDDSEAPLSDWEREIKESSKDSKCLTCWKILKPKSYIAGISKLSKNEKIYCACYKNVCHLCNTYQGYVTRFIAHQNYHDKEKPYACPDCWRRFNDFRHLNVHTWLTCFHTLSRRSFGCKICEIDGFPDVEAIARHFVVMHTYKKIACETCYLVISSYEEYKRHRQEDHVGEDTYDPIKLVVFRAGQCIVRYENVMAHVEKHNGVRRSTWFKCPFCTFSSFENKKKSASFETHLQSNHLDRLPELIEPQTLIDILPNSGLKELAHMYPKLFSEEEQTLVNAGIERATVPKIVNTRTITPEVFERGSQEGENNEEESINFVMTNTTNKDGIEYSVFSMNADESDKTADSTLKEVQRLSDDPNESDSLPKILDVRSIAKDVNEVSEKDEDTSSNKDTRSEVIEEKETEESCEETLQQVSDFNDGSSNSLEMTKQTTNSEEVTKDTIDPKIGSTDQCLQTENESTHSDKERSDKEEPDCIILSDAESISNNKDSSPTDHEKSNTQIQIRVKDIEKLRMTFDDEIEEIPSSSSTPQPPPLSRIPQYLLNPKPLIDVLSDDSKDSSEKKINNENTIKSTSGGVKNPNRPWRIALNGPATKSGESKDYLCHLCGQLINTSWSVMSDHFKTVHSEDYKLSIITPRLLRVSSEFIKGGYKECTESTISKKRKSENIAATTTKRRRRWCAKKYIDSKNSSLPDTGLCVKQETAKDADGTFKCKKCDRSCASMTDLRDHIASTHRIKGRYLICLECGENFVVAPSLQMHLKAFHGIEDPITYMTQNTSYAPDIMDDIEGEGKTTVANQCHVCMAVFEDKAAVDKHLRVHGMAFLNRKRIEARNALKSPEKRAENEQKIDSPTKDDKKSSSTTNAKVPAKRDNPAETILEKINAMI